MQTHIKPTRIPYLDIIRIIAIYMVVFNHSRTRGFMLFTIARESSLFWLYLSNSIFIKSGVPLFFMVSGALLLKDKNNYTETVKRFLKFFLILLVTSFILYLYKCFRMDLGPFSIAAFFKGFYVKPISSPLWYMYNYLAYVLMLPILKTIAQNMDRKGFQWVFLMYGLINLFPIIEFIMWNGEISHTSHFSFFITTGYVFYPLMGYYIHNCIKLEEIKGKFLVSLIVASVLAIGVCSALTVRHCTMIDEWNEETSQVYFNTLIFLPTITLFILLKWLFGRIELSEKVTKIISSVGGATFGLYLFEVVYREETKGIFGVLKPILHTFPACCIWILVACALGTVVTLIIKIIPGASKFI